MAFKAETKLNIITNLMFGLKTLTLTDELLAPTEVCSFCFFTQRFCDRTSVSCQNLTFGEHTFGTKCRVSLLFTFLTGCDVDGNGGGGGGWEKCLQGRDMTVP